jgi:hypothetical protein
VWARDKEKLVCIFQFQLQRHCMCHGEKGGEDGTEISILNFNADNSYLPLLNVQFFCFLMVQKWSAFSRNHTSSFDFQCFPSVAMCSRRSLFALSQADSHEGKQLTPTLHVLLSWHVWEARGTKCIFKLWDF